MKYNPPNDEKTPKVLETFRVCRGSQHPERLRQGHVRQKTFETFD